jgi:hypothetical protein
MSESGWITLFAALAGLFTSSIGAYVTMRIAIAKIQTGFEAAEKRRDERIIELLGQRDQRLTRNEKDIDDVSVETRAALNKFDATIITMRAWVEENFNNIRRDVYNKLSTIQADVSDVSSDIKVVKSQMAALTEDNRLRKS